MRVSVLVNRRTWAALVAIQKFRSQTESAGFEQAIDFWLAQTEQRETLREIFGDELNAWGFKE